MNPNSENLPELLVKYRELIPARGHVSYLCASRLTPRALVADGWPPGISFKRVIVDHPTWIVSGVDTTGADGKVTIDIGEYLHVPECSPFVDGDEWGPAIIDGRPTFIVTPHSREPVVVTATMDVTADEGNWTYRDLIDGHHYDGVDVEYKIKVTVQAWKLDGAPAATNVSWLCIAEGAMRWIPV